MRITIEIDEKSGTPPANSTAPSGPGAAGPASGAPPNPPAVAAATDALDGGAAPVLSGADDSAPHPFISLRGGTQGSTAPTAAVSAGSAAQSKPCG